MQLQGQSPINAELFNSTISKIENAVSCEELREAASKALAELTAQQSAITQQLAAFQPLLALLEPPTSPDQVVTWVKDFITNYLTIQLKPALEYPTQLAQLASQIQQLQSAVGNVSVRFPNCSI